MKLGVRSRQQSYKRGVWLVSSSQQSRTSENFEDMSENVTSK